MNSRYKDKLVGVYAPGNYGQTSVLDQTQEFSRWFWNNRKDMKLISIKLGIDVKKLNRILTLEQLPDEDLLRKMVELCNG
ncbi:hypothetical protein HMPREF2867_04180 [Streptococcus sp. HMSC064H09]|uniref:hypothetical protein n=1 Tax=Streptococcus sp. HMSC064H09 TaxID=1739371 RepID=UPI0008A1DE7A|nr:hypothetical protein [Streptococcus sp. HMSC064H09]OFR80789.1 hypothetical protein HMPREF2867_04180 [Streptococcus sp. HMSC064H09]